MAFFMQDIALVNLEKKRDPKNIFASTNNDIYKHYMTGNSTIKKSFDDSEYKKMTPGPEDEDMIQENYSNHMLDPDQIEQFIEIFVVKQDEMTKSQIQLGQTEFEISDSLIRKVYEVVIKDIPEGIPSKYKEVQPAPKAESKNSTLEFRWLGINAILRDKKDFTFLKLVEIKFNLKNEDSEKTMEVILKDFQVIQDEFEILMKYHNSQIGMGSRQQFLDQSDEDFQTNLFRFEQKTGKSKSQKIEISDFLFVFDFKRIITLL